MTKNKLWVYGCSMAWGQELPNKSRRWGNIVADAYGLEESNRGRCGAGNMLIQRRIFIDIPKYQKGDKIAIMWSDPLRVELTFPVGSNRDLCAGGGEYDKSKYKNLSGHKMQEALYSLMQLYPDALAYSHSVQHRFSTYLALKGLDIPFVFCYWKEKHSKLYNDGDFHFRETENTKETFYEDGVLRQTYVKQLELKNEFKTMIDTMKPHTFTDCFLYDNAKNKELPIGSVGRHPLKEGHNDFARMLLGSNMLGKRNG